MQKYEKIIVAAIVAVGLLMLGLCIKGGIDNFTNKDRRVTVKGLSEREVDADKVTWTMSVQVAGDDLVPLFNELNTKMDAIQQFLKEKGIKGKGEVTVNTYDVTDNLANAWGNNRNVYSCLVLPRLPTYIFRPPMSRILDGSNAAKSTYARQVYV